MLTVQCRLIGKHVKVGKECANQVEKQNDKLLTWIEHSFAWLSSGTWPFVSTAVLFANFDRTYINK